MKNCDFQNPQKLLKINGLNYQVVCLKALQQFIKFI